MEHCLVFLMAGFVSQIQALQPECNTNCPQGSADVVACAFDETRKIYKMFPNQCAFIAYLKCNEGISAVQTDLKFCLKNVRQLTRRMYFESCPSFCGRYYRPVCAISELHDTGYRTFVNQCHLDLVNCRGAYDASPFIEVPLSFCPKHADKNIFHERIRVISEPLGN